MIFNINNLTAPIQTVHIGFSPLSMIITPDNGYICCCGFCDGILVILIDLKTFEVVPNKMQFGKLPLYHYLAVTPDNQYIFISSGQIFVNQLSVLSS